MLTKGAQCGRILSRLHTTHNAPRLREAPGNNTRPTVDCILSQSFQTEVNFKGPEVLCLQGGLPSFCLLALGAGPPGTQAPPGGASKVENGLSLLTLCCAAVDR